MTLRPPIEGKHGPFPPSRPQACAAVSPSPPLFLHGRCRSQRKRGQIAVPFSGSPRMAGSGVTQQSLRKAFGALKDTTTVGLAKVNSDFKELDVAIVKATNHVEQLPKEKHIHTILESVSASRPRADVAYCITALSRRLAKTHNWGVALKTLIVIHRALREVDASFREELINYSRSRGHILNLSHFKDDSSPNAWDYSTWVRAYALYLEERLECLSILKYDIETEHSRTAELDTIELLEHLPALQQLLFRLLGCQPEGAAMYNSVIHYALSIVVGETIKIYYAINGCTLNLVDKFFDMQLHDAIRALEIYRKAGHQAERLYDFYEICKRSDFGRGKKFVKIEQPPASFVAAMEEYVKAASPRLVDANRRIAAPEPTLSIENKKLGLDDEKPQRPTTVPNNTNHSTPEPVTESALVPIPAQEPTSDLLGLDDFREEATHLEEKNALALAIISNDKRSNNADPSDESNVSLGWELALTTSNNSFESTAADSKLAGHFDKLTLDSLYEDALARRTKQNSIYHIGTASSNPFEPVQYNQDPFYASNSIAPPANVQLATMAQQQALMMGGQQQAVGHDNNPFGNPFGPAGVSSSYPAQNTYTGLM